MTENIVKFWNRLWSEGESQSEAPKPEAKLKIESLSDAKKFLLKTRSESIGRQYYYIKEINESFLLLIESKPSKEEFVKHMGSIVLTAEMFYEALRN